MFRKLFVPQPVNAMFYFPYKFSLFQKDCGISLRFMKYVKHNLLKVFKYCRNTFIHCPYCPFSKFLLPFWKQYSLIRRYGVSVVIFCFLKINLRTVFVYSPSFDKTKVQRVTLGRKFLKIYSSQIYHSLRYTMLKTFLHCSC